MLDRYEFKESEIRTGQKELKALKAEIAASIAPIAAILRDEELAAMVPVGMREEFDRFKEIYI